MAHTTWTWAAPAAGDYISSVTITVVLPVPVGTYYLRHGGVAGTIVETLSEADFVTGAYTWIADDLADSLNLTSNGNITLSGSTALTICEAEFVGFSTDDTPREWLLAIDGWGDKVHAIQIGYWMDEYPHEVRKMSLHYSERLDSRGSRGVGSATSGIWPGNEEVEG